MTARPTAPRAGIHEEILEIDGRPITDQWALLETIVEDGVSIGSNATILCGLRIGRGAMIGAGAVVTGDVAPGATVAEVPARAVRSGPRHDAEQSN